MVNRSPIATRLAASTLLLLAAGCVTIQPPNQISDSSSSPGAINGGSLPSTSGTPTPRPGSTSTPAPTPTPVPYGTVSWQTASATLPQAVTNTAGAVVSTGANSSAFIVVGGTTTSSGLVATVTGFPFSNGSLGSANNLTPYALGTIPTPICSEGVVADGSNLVVIGGLTTSQGIPNVSTGAVSGGSIASWAATGALNAGRQDAGYATDASEHAYVVGGRDNGAVAQSTIQMGTLSGTGAASGWTTLSVPLPESLIWASAVVVNNVLYVFGGREGVTGPMHNDVLAYNIASNGTLSPATFMTNQLDTGGTLPATAGGGLVAYQNKLYLFGGLGSTWNCFISVIGANGQLTPWHAVTTNQDPVAGLANMAFGSDNQGHIFLAGGVAGGTLSNKVYVGTIQ